MAYPSKEDVVLKQFYLWSTRHWTFSWLAKETKLPDNKLSKWLKKLIEEKMIKKVVEKGKRPYYIANYKGATFMNRKRLYGWQELQDSGLFDALLENEHITHAILFGSYDHGDWHTKSDIDLCIIGEEPDLYKFEKKLRKEIQLFICEDRTAFGNLSINLLKNIIRGIPIKGYMPLDWIKNEDPA